MVDTRRSTEAFARQTGDWDRMADVYVREIDRRFAPVVEAFADSAALRTGERVLDLGTGTGAVARRAAADVGPGGRVVGVDVSAEMIARARRAAAQVTTPALTFIQARAESVPTRDEVFDVVLACLSMMYVIDRAAAAREIARVLGRGGRFLAAAWAGPEHCDIVRFQQAAARFAGPPPVAGVGPGALADPGEFLRQLAAAGITAAVETHSFGFDFPDFQSAWDALAGVTAATLPPEQKHAAMHAVRADMYPHGDGPRHFRNGTHFIIGRTGS
jgi:ubiquinone/menaquinone biosynthesis C-methylase UbiE